MFAEVYPVEACYAVRRCTLITKGAVTETLSVSASVSAYTTSPDVAHQHPMQPLLL